MFNYPYIVEMLTPKRTGSADPAAIDTFAGRYRRVIDAGCGVSIPDNPMGQPRLGALECIDLCGLPVAPEKLVMNLNTFHTKNELDRLLQKADRAGLKYILVVRGDGGPLLPKLDAGSIGGSRSVPTSIDLIRYIHTGYAGRFVTGAAFNPYRPAAFELKRMEQKMSAGAKFAVTQPIIGRDERVDALKELNIPVVVEAWMSKNIDLLYKSVGKEKDEGADAYDPVGNLKALHRFYPECTVYLSMLSFKQQWGDILPRLPE